MRRKISDWFAPKNNTSVTTNDNAPPTASPLSPLSSSKKANHDNNESALLNATNGRAPGKTSASSVNKTPKRESGRRVQVSKTAMTTELSMGKLQQKLTLSPVPRKMTDVEATSRLEGLATPKLALDWEDRDGTPSPVRNNALTVDGQSSSQVTVLSDQVPTASLTSIVKAENAEAKELSENTTPTSTRSVSTSRTEDVPTPSSFRSAVERLDREASSVAGSLSQVTEEKPDEVINVDSEDCEPVKHVHEVVNVEDVELVESDDSISATATMTATPAQKHSARPNIIETSSELSSPPSSLLSMTLVNESAVPVEIIDLDSESEYGSSQSPAPTPTPAVSTKVEIAPKAEPRVLEDVPTICRRELRSSALASILASSRKSTNEESPTTAKESSRFVIKVPIVPPPSPSSIITCTPKSLSSTSGPTEIQEPKKNVAPSSFLSSLIEKSARKPARPVKTAIPSALRDLYARAAEIQRFDSLMAESKALEHQSHCLDQPRSNEAIDNDVMKAAVGVENATQMAALLGKVESEKSKTVEFHYFDIGRLEVSEMDREKFPGLPAGWLSECLHDPEMRNVMFESGFVRDMIDLENKLPKCLVWWLMLEVARESNDFLAHSYLQTLLLCDDALHADEEVLDKLFYNLGVKLELRHANSEMTLSRIKGDDKSIRFRTHNIKFTLELLHAIIARRTYDRRFFRKVMIFTIRALLDSAVGKSLYSSLSDLFSVIISSIPIEHWLTEETFLLRTLFSTVTDSKERVRLLTLVPINQGTHAMHLRTKLAIAFFLNDVDFVVDSIADGRLPIAKRILPELLSNPMYRLRVTKLSRQKQGGEVPQITVGEMQDMLQPSTLRPSGSADAEQQENSVHSPSPGKLKVVVSSDPEDEPGEELLETSPTTDNGDDDIEFDYDSEDDDDESSKVDYVLLTQRIWCLNFALMTAVRLDKDIRKIKVITDFLRELNNKIFDPHARFPDRTEAKAAIQACEFRLLYSVVGGNGVRQSVIEKHFEYTKRSPRKNYKGKKRKEIEE
ncbi:hypothetical protein V1505DRAFT_366198 [Lipomyces doorenjongii]